MYETMITPQEDKYTRYPGISGQIQVPRNFLGQGASSDRGDVFGYSVPHQDQVLGSMYNAGPSFAEMSGQHGESRLNYQFNEVAPPQIESSAMVENFELEKGTTPVDNSFLNLTTETVQFNVAPYVTLALFVVLYVAVYYWSKAAETLINMYVFGGFPEKAWHLVAVAVIITSVFIGGVYLSGISLKTFETI